MNEENIPIEMDEEENATIEPKIRAICDAHADCCYEKGCPATFYVFPNTYMSFQGCGC